MIYVAETDKEARNDMRDCYNEIIKWEIANTPHHQKERIPPGGTFDDINFDYLVDTNNLLVGSPDTVTKQVKGFYDRVGGFGTMMFHAGRPYATAEKRARSMELFMREVAPRLRHLDADEPAARPSRRNRVCDAACNDAALRIFGTSGQRPGATKITGRNSCDTSRILVVAAAMLAAAFASPLQAQTKITVGYTAAIDIAPLFIAVDKGFFQKRGLDVTPQLMSVNSVIPPALASDSIQIGMPTASTFLQAVDGGLDLVGISGLNITRKNDVNFAIVTRTGANISKPQDFIGKKVGVPGLNAFLHVMFREWLKANGVDPKQVNYVETAFPQMNEIMKSGNVDAVVAAEPFQGRIIKAGTGSILSYFTRELPEGLPVVFFATTRKWATANPAAVKSFHDAMAEAMAYLPANLDESRQITAKYLKLPLEIVASVNIPPLVPDVQCRRTGALGRHHAIAGHAHGHG